MYIDLNYVDKLRCSRNQKYTYCRHYLLKPMLSVSELALQQCRPFSLRLCGRFVNSTNPPSRKRHITFGDPLALNQQPHAEDSLGEKIKLKIRVNFLLKEKAYDCEKNNFCVDRKNSVLISQTPYRGVQYPDDDCV